MKRIYFIVISLMFIFIAAIAVLFSCRNADTNIKISLEDDYNECFTEDILRQKGHRKTLPGYSTDSSVAFLNDDGSTTLYVYASPIRYLNQQGEYAWIDTRLTNVVDEKLLEEDDIYMVAANDITPLYPAYLTDQKGIKLIDKTEYEIGVYTDKKIKNKVVALEYFVGDKKNMVSYKNGEGSTIHFYLSNIGTNCEIRFDEPPDTNVYNLWLRFQDASLALRNRPDGTIIICNKALQDIAPKDILGIIQEPILKFEDMDISYHSSLEFEKIDDVTYNLKLILEKEYLEKNACAFISFEMRREKQPDNAMYSGKPDWQNTYLKNFSVIGNSEEYGT